MEFNEIVVKESPGLCRCCLSEGCYKDLGSEYTWMNEAEVYADMLLECFDISITQHNEGPNGPSRLICEVCITRLRDACNFKKQVLDSEKKFIDMLGRGEFRPKVLIYQTQMKTENSDEQVQEEVEYLEDDLDFDDDEVLKPSVDEHSSSPLETVTSETISLKRKLKTKKTKISRPKKHVEVDEKPKSSKAVSKGAKPTSDKDKSLSTTMRNRLMKKNAIAILENSSVMPFKWQLKDFLCFYCHLPFKDIEQLKEHTREKHKTSNVKSAVTYLKMDDKVKIDITDAICKLCEEDFVNLNVFIQHLNVVHDLKLSDEFGYGVVPYRISKDDLKCGICEEEFQYFITLNQHMNKHFATYICEQCGKAYLSYDRLRAHYLMHGARFRCRYCDEAFESLVKRKVHEAESHDQSNPIQCAYCSETFINYNARKKHHSRIHNIDVTVFKCPVCGKEYPCRSRMETHVREVHIKERNFSCTMCESKFFSKAHLHKHMTRHIGMRVHQCTICKKAYVRKQNLMDHMKIHTNK